MLPDATLALAAPMGVQAGIEEIEVVETPEGPMVRDNIAGTEQPLPNPVRALVRKIQSFFREILDVAKGALNRIELSAQVALIVGAAILAWNVSR